jgi:hypothetical protein
MYCRVHPLTDLDKLAVEERAFDKEVPADLIDVATNTFQRRRKLQWVESA